MVHGKSRMVEKPLRNGLQVVVTGMILQVTPLPLEKHGRMEGSCLLVEQQRFDYLPVCQWHTQFAACFLHVSLVYRVVFPSYSMVLCIFSGCSRNWQKSEASEGVGAIKLL